MPSRCYTDGDYRFYYDWLLDPYEVADQFHDYIEAVKVVTHSDKVSIIAKCLGTNVVLAYIEKYGTDSIYGLGLDGGTVNGVEPLSEALSEKFKIDGNAITGTLVDCNVFGVTKEYIYYKVVEGVTSALALSTVMTWPGYWAGVKQEDYDEAIDYVFGDENDEKRTEYAGLIAKLDNYNEKVRTHINDLLLSTKQSGAIMAFIAKYGCQMIPICESENLIADQFVSVKSASFGATTSTIYDTLSDEYIAQREAEGKGKYISPDKQKKITAAKHPIFLQEVDVSFFLTM